MSARAAVIPDVVASERTPHGAGAVSVVELAGPRALDAAVELGAPHGLARGDVRVARLTLADGLCDEALVVVRAADRVEIGLHGSPALVRALLARFARPAPPRSLAERAEELLAGAPSEDGARILLDQAEGALARELRRVAGLPLDAARAAADELARRAEVARRALDPSVVVLAGPVNAGKSTLFNVLAGEARALVSDEPGTTRDVLAAEIVLDGWPVRVLDTAGERAIGGEAHVEAEGQRRARALRRAADLVLWLVPVDAHAPPPAPDAVPLVTQADRAARHVAGAISARADPSGARRAVGAIVRTRLGLPERAWEPGRAAPFAPDLASACADAAAGRRDPRGLAQELDPG